MIRAAKEDLQAKVMADSSYNVEDWMWLATPQMHITFIMIHLDDPDTLSVASDVMMSLQPKI